MMANLLGKKKVSIQFKCYAVVDTHERGLLETCHYLKGNLMYGVDFAISQYIKTSVCDFPVMTRRARSNYLYTLCINGCQFKILLYAFK